MTDAAEYMNFLEEIKNAGADPLCMQIDPELWFPEKGDANRAAIRFCGQCPVQQACLRYALKTDQKYGIWGGLTADQRSRLLGRGRGRPVNRPSQSRRPDSPQEHPEQPLSLT